MIETISGEPGGGKSYWGVQRIAAHIAIGGVVVTNLPIRGMVDTGRDGCLKWALSKEAPLRDYLRTFHKWEYQEVDGGGAENPQLVFLDQEMVCGDWIKFLPKGTPRKHVLFVWDEVGDTLDSLDRARLNAKNDYYRRLFEFLRLHRHYFIDVVLLIQDYGSMNDRIRRLCKYVHKTVDMQGRKLAGLPIKYPFPRFKRFTYDRTGRILLDETSAVKEKCVFAIYDSYNDHGNFDLVQGRTVDFSGVGTIQKRVKKMNAWDRLLLVAVLVVCVGMGFVGSSRSGVVAAPSGVHVVVVTNTLPAVVHKGGKTVVVEGESNDEEELPDGERVTVEYCPLSFTQAGDDKWCYAQGRLFRVGMQVKEGRVVSIDNWGIRIVGSRGEHFIYNFDNAGVVKGAESGRGGPSFLPKESLCVNRGFGDR